MDGRPSGMPPRRGGSGGPNAGGRSQKGGPAGTVSGLPMALEDAESDGLGSGAARASFLRTGGSSSSQKSAVASRPWNFRI